MSSNRGNLNTYTCILLAHFMLSVKKILFIKITFGFLLNFTLALRTIHFALFPYSDLEVTRCHRLGSARDRRTLAWRMFAREMAQEQCVEYRTCLRKKLNFDAVAAEASGSSAWSLEIRVTLLELSRLGDGRGRVGRYVGIYTPALASHEYRLSLERGYVIMS